MNAPFLTLIRAASLTSLALFATSTPLRAADNDGDTKPGFFHRLGNAIFKGTRKLEKSDASPDAPDTSPENAAPVKPAPAKPTPAPKKPVKRVDDSTSSVNDGSGGAKDKDYPSSATDQKRSVSPSKATADDKETTKGAANSSATKGASTTDAASADSKDYPTATRGKKPGFVKSPYPPYQELDTTGMISGSLAKDPITGKVFRIP